MDKLLSTVQKGGGIFKGLYSEVPQLFSHVPYRYVFADVAPNMQV